MPGILGFIVGAVVIGFFAATSIRAYTAVDKAKLQLFSLSFGLLATAMLLWALTIGYQQSTSTITSLLLASDILLITGTVLMALILVGTSSILSIIGLATVGALLASLRALHYPPTGYVKDGLLYFNLTNDVKTVIMLAFGLVWLPAVIVIARQAARDGVFKGLERALISCFIALVLLSALFMTARRSAVIISLFIVIAVIFAGMGAINLMIIQFHASYKNVKGKKHVA